MGSSRNFSEIFIFWVVTQAVLLENSSNRHLENSGASHRPFYWKTHPLKIMDTYSVFFNSGASHRPFYWKTHPDNFSNLFLIFLKKPLFLEEKQVNDET